MKDGEMKLNEQSSAVTHVLSESCNPCVRLHSTGSGGLEGRLGLQVCVSLVQFIQGNERRCFNIDNGAWSIEREKANSSMREPEIVWRAGVRIDSDRESSQRLSQRNHRAPVLDETS